MILAFCLPALLALSPPAGEVRRSLVDFRVERAPEPRTPPGWTMPEPPDPPLVKGRGRDGAGDVWDYAPEARGITSGRHSGSRDFAVRR